MKKKFLQIVSMVLTIVMILPTMVYAADYTIAVGETKNNIEVSLPNASSHFRETTCTSSDSTVATASYSNGKLSITGVAAGTATITISYTKSGMGGPGQVTKTVQVTAPTQNEPPVQNPLKIFNGETEVTNGTVNMSTEGSKSTVTLTVTGGSGITWRSSDSETVSVSGGTLTAKKVGSVTIYAYSDALEATCTVNVAERTLSDISIVGTPKSTYVTGESFSFASAIVEATYSDGSKEDVTSKCTVSPSEDLRKTDTSVTVSYQEDNVTKTKTANITVTDDTITGIKIVSPSTGTEYKVGDTIAKSSVSIEVSYAVGKPVTLNAEDYSDITISPSGALEKTHKELTVTYGGKSDKILILVKEEATTPSTPSTPTQSTYTVVLTKNPNTLSYTVGQKLDLTGITFDIYKNGTLYRNMTSANLSSFNYTFTSADIGTTSKVINFTFDSTPLSLTITGLTVTRGTNATEIDDSESKYELQDEEDIDIKIGDKLNDDVEWDDIFKEVRIKVDGEWKTIDSKSDLDNYPGVKLLLKVYNKSSDSDVIEAGDINSDGEVRLQLYIKNGSTSITDTSKSIRVYVPVEDVECTVSIYSSKTYTSSSYLKASKTFDDFEEALAALMDEEELEDEFDVTLGLGYAIRIKFGEDQTLHADYEFEPDYDNPIYIDLNGNELKLPSDWINYDDCADLTVTVTNGNTKKDASLVYRDQSVALLVANGSQLVFAKGKIPMSSDASCTVTIQRSSSSSTVIATKVYDDFREALEALEDKDEAVENFSIPSTYDDTFVVKIVFGEDQSLGSFNFAPNYDTTISIDLNGYELKLKSDWIDYDDCEDLVVSVNNTNADEKGTLTYSDKTTSALIAKGDSAFKFEEGKIPGLYKVEIGTVTNGKVTANPNKTALGKGNNVTFTITPNAGYEISTVKNGTKTISTSTSGYTVDSKGVATYKVENISADIKLEVTFKKTSASSSSSSSSSSAANWNNPFTDVTTNAQYYDAVAYVCSEGLFNGMTATKFEPYTTMTRAMFVTVLGRLAGINEMLYSGTSFTDVSKYDQQIAWAAPYIEWAVQKGITNGTGNGKFSPNEPITHQQMYLFMQRYAEKIAKVDTSTTGVNLSGIRDAAQIADWAEDGVKFASKYGILITSDSKLTPTSNAYRCELAMLLHGFCVKVLEQ